MLVQKEKKIGKRIEYTTYIYTCIYVYMYVNSYGLTKNNILIPFICLNIILIKYKFKIA